MAALHSSNSMGPNETKGGKGKKKKKHSFRFIWHRKGQWPTAANAVNVHHAIIAHTYTRRKHTVWHPHNKQSGVPYTTVLVCVCTQTGTGGRGRGGPRGQTGSMAESTVCLVALAEKWRSLLGTQSDSRTCTHAPTHTRGGGNNAITQKLGRKIRHEGEPAGMKSWTGTKTGRACGTRSHALTLLQ